MNVLTEYLCLHTFGVIPVISLYCLVPEVPSCCGDLPMNCRKTIPIKSLCGFAVFVAVLLTGKLKRLHELSLEMETDGFMISSQYDGRWLA